LGGNFWSGEPAARKKNILLRLGKMDEKLANFFLAPGRVT
jgi:hypothetical protein